MLSEESLSLICQLEQSSEQELVVDGKLLDEIEKNKLTLSKILTVCNSPDQIEAINLFVLEHTERPGRVQELRKLRLSEVWSDYFCFFVLFCFSVLSINKQITYLDITLFTNPLERRKRSYEW